MPLRQMGDLGQVRPLGGEEGAARALCCFPLMLSNQDWKGFTSFNWRRSLPRVSHCCLPAGRRAVACNAGARPLVP
jgi:hypothetical protein